MLGIGEIEKAVDVLAGLANLGGGVLADGKIDLSDMSQLIPLGLVLKDVIGLDAGLLGKQLADFEANEREAIVARFKQKFDIPHDNLEAQIESALSLLNRIAGIIEEVIMFAKSFKKA